MDEVVGLILEQFAKKMRESRRDRALQRTQARASRSNTVGGPPVRIAPVARAIPAPPQPLQPPQRQAPSASRRAERAPGAPDPFAALGTPEPAASPLLAAFANGPGLLAGIILSEALAPPVALRERHPGRS